MKTYSVLLTKSYIVTVKSETAQQAKNLAEFYTGDISDISSEDDKAEKGFEIEKIECKINESLEAVEV